MDSQKRDKLLLHAINLICRHIDRTSSDRRMKLTAQYLQEKTNEELDAIKLQESMERKLN